LPPYIEVPIQGGLREDAPQIASSNAPIYLKAEHIVWYGGKAGDVCQLKDTILFLSRAENR
jgi:hypothetical protein